MIVIWNDVSSEGNAKNSTDVAAIQESLNNMLATMPGERLFNPQFGCNLEGLLFEICDEDTADLILVELMRCLGGWDPRIGVDFAATRVEANPDYNRFDIYLVVRVYGVSAASTFQFSLNSFDQTRVQI